MWATIQWSNSQTPACSFEFSKQWYKFWKCIGTVLKKNWIFFLNEPMVLYSYTRRCNRSVYFELLEGTIDLMLTEVIENWLFKVSNAISRRWCSVHYTLSIPQFLDRHFPGYWINKRGNYDNYWTTPFYASIKKLNVFCSTCFIGRSMLTDHMRMSPNHLRNTS